MPDVLAPLRRGKPPQEQLEQEPVLAATRTVTPQQNGPEVRHELRVTAPQVVVEKIGPALPCSTRGGRS
ncbi:hypothetical protein [Kitasatospora sp. MMS16-BH015]|uniref:hypothetical protein n=1 Tax=Kitasatospora sp. MMS16-BH015 TaxID=2018025 RepID=UPI00131A4EDE|nr:hypothetical protein [Kitasatospora sp. MMS16-BH015]